MNNKSIDLFWIAAGGGHFMTAEAIKSGLSKLRPDVDVNLINIREVLDSVDPIKNYLGFNVENFYNFLLKSGYTYGHKYWLTLSHKLINLWEDRILKGVKDFYEYRPKPDILISCVPHFNRLINTAIHDIGINIPTIIVNSDMFDRPPHYWYEEGLKDCFFVCPTPEAVTQALLECNVPSNKIVHIDGVILKPEFYNKENIYDGDNLYITVSTGGYGSSSILDLAEKVPHSYPANFIYVCGRNTKLWNQLIQVARDDKDVILGYSNMFDVLKFSSAFVGKPGPASISEALIMGVPVIVENNKYTMVQERANVDWVIRNGYGAAIPSISDLVSITNNLRNLDFFKENVSKFSNTGLRDFIDFLVRLL